MECPLLYAVSVVMKDASGYELFMLYAPFTSICKPLSLSLSGDDLRALIR